MRGKFKATVTDPYRVPGTSRICHLHVIIWGLEPLAGGKAPLVRFPASHTILVSPYMAPESPGHLNKRHTPTFKLLVVNPFMTHLEALDLSGKGTPLLTSKLFVDRIKKGIFT